MVKNSTLKKSISTIQSKLKTTAEQGPSNQTLNNIFAFSKAYVAKKSKTVEHIELVLN
jgi:hypothetical protein